MRKPSPEEFQRALEGTGDEAELQALVRLVKALEHLRGPSEENNRLRDVLEKRLSRSGLSSPDRG